MFIKSIFREFFWYYRKYFNRSTIGRSNIFWKENRNKYKGYRGFVIGNGPSLKINDLDFLQNEVTIASNKIYLAFEKTEWRPSFHTMCDRLLWGKLRNEIYKYIDNIIIPHKFFGGNKVNNIYFKDLGLFQFHDIGFSSDILDGVFSGDTITYMNLQIAVHLGLNPIYLIGCDHYYLGESNIANHYSSIRHSDFNNHFIKNYRVKGEKVNPASIDMMTNAFKNAKTFCEKNNIKIFNATNGGHLKVFPRVDYYSLFPGNVR